MGTTKRKQAIVIPQKFFMWKILVFTMSANLNKDINVKGKKAMYVELFKKQ